MSESSIIKVSMRDKTKGCLNYGLKFQFKNGAEHITFRKNDGYFLKCFTDGLFERNRCLSCELFKEKHAIAVVSVCEMEHSPLWSNTLPENNSLSGFLRADSNKQRQKLETFYRINGAIYMADVKAFLENTNLYREDCYAYKMPAERSIDIDTELDFKIAETIINQ